MAPAKIKNVVSKAEEYHTTDGEEGADELSELTRERRE